MDTSPVECPAVGDRLDPCEVSQIWVVTKHSPCNVFRSGVPVVDAVVYAVPDWGAIRVETVVARPFAEAEDTGQNRHKAGVEDERVAVARGRQHTLHVTGSSCVSLTSWHVAHCRPLRPGAGTGGFVLDGAHAIEQILGTPSPAFGAS
jgi:hypothetical protein